MTTFKTAGCLDPVVDEAIYMKRAEDASIANYVTRQEYVTLLGPRQTGKTSLLLRLQRDVNRQFIPVFLDLSSFAEERRKEVWYQHVANSIANGLHLAGVAVGNNVTSRGAEVSDGISLMRFLVTLCEETTGQLPFLLMIDEIGTVPKEWADSFFRNIRAAYNSSLAQQDRAFRRVTFIFAGNVLTETLIQGEGSPFNITHTVFTSDAPLSEVRRLVSLIGLHVDLAAAAWVYQWTGGHVQHTQQLCAALAEMPNVGLTRRMVDDAAMTCVRSNANIRGTLQLVQRNDEWALAIQALLTGGRLQWGNPVADNLVMAGAVKLLADGSCVIRNKMIETALRDHIDVPRRKGSSEVAVQPAPAEESKHGSLLVGGGFMLLSFIVIIAGLTVALKSLADYPVLAIVACFLTVFMVICVDILVLVYAKAASPEGKLVGVLDKIATGLLKIGVLQSVAEWLKKPTATKRDF